MRDRRGRRPANAPISPSDVVDVSLNCSSNAGPTPPPTQVPVKAVSWSLSGIGMNAGFVHP